MGRPPKNAPKVEKPARKPRIPAPPMLPSAIERFDDVPVSDKIDVASTPKQNTDWKRGILNKDEKLKIQYEHIKKSVEQLSLEMRRTPEMIQKEIDQYSSSNPHLPILRDLRDSPSYQSLRLELSIDELLIFESQYITLSKEFHLDELTAFELNQLQDYVLAEVRVRRYRQQLQFYLLEQRHVQAEIETVRKGLAQNSEVRSRNDDTAARELVAILTDQLKAITQEMVRWDGLVNETENFKRKTLESLKATRQQRLDKVTDVKRNFMSLLKELYEEEFRRKEIKTITMMNKAVEKTTERYAEPMTLKDGTIEQPILTVESFRQWQEAENGQA